MSTAALRSKRIQRAGFERRERATESDRLTRDQINDEEYWVSPLARLARNLCEGQIPSARLRFNVRPGSRRPKSTVCLWVPRSDRPARRSLRSHSGFLPRQTDELLRERILASVLARCRRLRQSILLLL